MLRVMKNILNSKVLLVFVLMFSFLGACSAAKKNSLPKVVVVTDDWCADCVAMDPILKEAEKNFKGKIEFESFNIKTKEAKKYEKYTKQRGSKPPMYVLFNKDAEHLVTYQGLAPKASVLELFDVLATGKKAEAPAPTAKAVPDLEDIGQKGLPVVVLHYADWCPYCRKFMPIIEELSKEYAGKIHFAKWNVEEDEGKKLSAKYRSSQGGIPYVEFFDKKGKYIGESLGFSPKEAFTSKVKSTFKI